VCQDEIIDLYERHARAYDRDRDRSLMERAWLDRMLDGVRAGGTILDVGCGMGEPIARYLIRARQRRGRRGCFALDDRALPRALSGLGVARAGHA
jgi:ubiquinone/menaquinone biosynthesis C-methylase UbiE